MDSKKPQNQSDNKDETNGNHELEKIEQEVEKLSPILYKELKIKNLPREKRKEVLSSLLILSKSHRGPLPAPEDLEHYGKVIPNGADRIMTMAEKQLSHRIELENHAVKEQLFQGRLGQIFGFIIALVCIGSGTYLAMNEQKEVGGILLGSTLIGLVSIFVIGKIFQGKDLKEKK